MIKKIFISLGVFTIIIMLSTMWLYGCFDIFSDKINGEFSVEDHHIYQIMYDTDHIEEFVYIGEVNDISELRKHAQKIWIDKYGLKIRFEQRPYDVFYDPQHDLYLVSGTIDAALGGVANMFVERETGKILAVWHDK